ncbi:hypothetical protein [Agromyces sp. Marseille-P2726]|uniref:hypothetical protein n=1 Tax=Agromyces sp. Marseille-P2726 TaxID=2709132 RepID=UPI00156F8E24|nr:hypothetical protein [Agromyces sp. Marseille-P2726]
MTEKLDDQRATQDRRTDDRFGRRDAARPSHPPQGPGWDRAPAASGSILVPPRNCWDFITFDPELSDTVTGVGVHRVIREQVGEYIARQGYGPNVKVRIPGASFDHYRDKNTLSIGHKGGGHGDVDLAFCSIDKKTMLVAEVKPANTEAATGDLQIGFYIEKANEDASLKTKLGVKEFARMGARHARLPTEVVYLSRRFQVKWWECVDGVILYKEIDKKRRNEKGKQKEKASKGSIGPTVEIQGRKIQLLTSAPRPRTYADWVPSALRRDIEANALPDGVYRGRYTAMWPSGYSADVVVWVDTGPLGREHFYYHEFPRDPAFYDDLARKVGLSDWQRDLVRSTLVEYNEDIWRRIAPDPVTGVQSSMNPYHARDDLRVYYADRLKAVVGGAATVIVTAGVTAAASTTITAAQRGVVSKLIEREAELVRSEPLPSWVMAAIRAGAAEAKAAGGGGPGGAPPIGASIPKPVTVR